ncbi:LUD domain-containing protein [Algoriphagus sp. AK58]|uniref:LutC/YkgG family protein n=1 Tax=Algoriphagus sp. AK58 TaxID=1406877 RepID=UPI00164EFB39|nr:LUD domain-containing protein [Algoriphagus sp. AK58]MBC6366744.1 L-lactate dehydrogenase [Algoriphagus sp. AK58]
MSSRESILNAIRGIEKEEKPLPELPLFGISEDVETGFRKSIEGNKGYIVSEQEFLNWLSEASFPKVYSASSSYASISTLSLPEDPHDLEDLNLAILEGQFGVAENGAIWLDDQQLPHRAIPFITEHLVIILKKENLIPTLHQAYDRIGLDYSGFGLFVAGPSKTADIEQSLVIGAHGAKSLRVVLC